MTGNGCRGPPISMQKLKKRSAESLRSSFDHCHSFLRREIDVSSLRAFKLYLNTLASGGHKVARALLLEICEEQNVPLRFAYIMSGLLATITMVTSGDRPQHAVPNEAWREKETKRSKAFSYGCEKSRIHILARGWLVFAGY